MVLVFVTGLTISMLLGLLTLISTMIGQRLPQIVAALDAGASEAARGQAALRYAV